MSASILLSIVILFIYLSIPTNATYFPRCSVEQGISYVDHEIYDDHIALILHNSMEEDINISKISLEGCNGTSSEFMVVKIHKSN